MKKALLLLLFATPLLRGEDAGIHFVTGKSWDEVIAMAAAEHKDIFVDCYATWCGPCKVMEKEIYPLADVGTYFNAHFISVKEQMDQTPKDSAEIKARYPDVAMLVHDYGVNAYPTYLIFDANGTPVHRFVGGSATGTDFIAAAANAFIPENSYYTLVRGYRQHSEDQAFLRNALRAALKASDAATAAQICASFVATLHPPYKADDLALVTSASLSTQDVGFKWMLSRTEELDKVQGKGSTESNIVAVIYNSLVGPVIEKPGATVDWESLEHVVSSQFPRYAERVMGVAKSFYYGPLHQQWGEYAKIIVPYMEANADVLSRYDLNDAAWTVFSHCEDPAVLAAALGWSKRAIDNYPAVEQITYLDTYANLLYKSGDKAGAIEWEKKAIALSEKTANDTERSRAGEWTTALKKMQAGEKTWE